jgi:S1-C subfamily serine protease
VAEVEPDTPAAKAGVRAGDIIVEFDGTAVRDGAQLRKAVREAAGGAAVTMKVQRERKELDLEVTLPEREKPERVRHTTGVSL